MEIHHAKIEKRTFKEYFLEFIMIFLAVTLGFIAENVREKLSERSKEKEYILNLKKDLSADTAALNDFLPSLNERINQTDTLIKLLQVNGISKRGSDLYYLARVSTKIRNFFSINTTVTELEHSGNFRLITKQPIINRVIKYQKIIDAYKAFVALDERETEMFYPLLGNLFDASVFNTMEKTGNLHFAVDTAASTFSSIEKPSGNPQLRKDDPDLINQLIFYLHERKGSFIEEAGVLQEQQKAAIKLLQTIDEEYHFKEE